MITKTKKSISLSNSILKEVNRYNKDCGTSEFIEKALNYYLKELKRQERGRRDIKIINANSKRFNKDAEENLQFQAML
jgi:metal-responsive CopG/Arc/MetJ family transcriptional regulator